MNNESSNNNFERLAELELPNGSWVRNTDGKVVAWISDEPINEDLRQRVLSSWPTTGLWPLVATGLGSAGNLQPWHTEELEPTAPEEPGTADLDAASILAERWAEETEDSAEFALAAPTKHAHPTAAALQETAAKSLVLTGVSDGTSDSVGSSDSSEPGYLLLVPVRDPALAIAELGWFGACNYDFTPEELAAVAKSWQDRFGASLVGIGMDTLTFELPGPLDGGQAADMVREYIAVGSFESPEEEDIEAFSDELATETQWLFWWD